jgi:4-hydroxy-tetrahydrodipicolinate synthase
MMHDVPPADQPAGLPPGSYVMGLTPFNRDGGLDEGALREHVRWMARENVGFWPASPATGEGAQMTDAEIFRVLEIVTEEMAGRIPVVAGNREYPTAAQNIRFAAEAGARGADAVQVYPPTLGHSFTPNTAMFERFYDEVLSAVDVPVVLSSNFMTGFEVPAAVLDRPIREHPHVIGVFKHHPDQQNVAEFTARFAPYTTVLTMAQKRMFSYAAGSVGELDNLQNVAPRLCRRLHDALGRGDLAEAGDAYRTVTALWSGISGFCARFAAPRVVVYKAVLGILGRPGGSARKPYVELGEDAVKELARVVDAVGLRGIEGLG